MENKSSFWIIGGGLLAAITASLCCIGPVVFIALGLGSFAAATTFEAMRPVFIVLALGFLGWAWYVTLRRRNIVYEEGTSCKSKPVSKSEVVLLSVLSLAVVAFAAFPHLVLLATDRTTGQEAAKMADGTRITVSIPSMNCPVCSSSIQTVLKKTEGVLAAVVTYKTKSASIVFDEKKITKNQIIELIENTGFKAESVEL